MDSLKEIIELVTPNKIKSIQIIGNCGNKDTKLQQFYEAIASGKVKNDEEAEKLLYGEKGNKNAYQKLKHTLRERLLNTVFFIDVKEKKYSDQIKAILYLQKKIVIFHYLRHNNAEKTAMKMGEKIIKAAIKYEIPEIVAKLSHTLGMYHALKTANQKKAEEYFSMRKKYSALLAAEYAAGEKKRILISYYVKEKSTKTFIHKKADEFLKGIEAIRPSITSYNLINQIYGIKLIKFMSINDYHTSEKICKEGIAKLEKCPFEQKGSLSFLMSNLIACQIHLKKYDEGRKNIEKKLNIDISGTFTWFKTQEQMLTLSLHTKYYLQAWETYKLVRNHKKFEVVLPKPHQESWKLYEAWLRLLIAFGAIELPKEEKDKLGEFKLFKFLNNVHIASQDKEGRNITVLILKILWLIRQKKYDRLDDNIEAISKYETRYLKKNNNFRSNLFIRMLLQIPKVNYVKSEVIKHAERYHKRLKEMPANISGQAHDVEILPIEDVWDLILAQLDERGRSN